MPDNKKSKSEKKPQKYSVSKQEFKKAKLRPELGKKLVLKVNGKKIDTKVIKIEKERVILQASE
ncbi:hypothetical protein JXC34_00270 [Candidatus Woesearchaeota archaeon]|nr:hypothetical protein [Candidatus Woesearchaeota archaeon]